MSSIRLRPTFLLTSSQTNVEAIRKVQSDVQGSSADIVGKFKGNHAVISIVGPDRHFWSPWLNLDFRENESGCEIFGRFSPHPSIWTAFAFAYSAIAVLIFFSGIVGMSQQLTNQTPIGYYSIPVWICIGVLLWFASQIGQKLAMKQMVFLKQLIERSVADSLAQT